MPYVLTQYEPALRSQAIDLVSSVLGLEAATASAYFAWKFEENPHQSEPLLFLALDAQRVVGLRGFYAAACQQSPEKPPEICPCAGGIMVDPAHRGRDLYQRLNAFALRELEARGFSYVFNLSPSPPNHLASLKAGWRLIASYRTAVRESRWHFLARRFHTTARRLPFLWRYAEVLESWLSRRSRFDELDNAAGTLERTGIRLSLEPEPDRMARIAHGNQSGRLRHAALPAYFAWRYRNPLSEYRFLFFGKESAEGFLALQRSKLDPAGPVNIVDWQLRESETMADLLETVLNSGRFPYVAIWTVTLTDASREQLVLIGFEPADESRGFAGYEPGLLVKATTSASDGSKWSLCGRALLNVDSWDLRMIFSDRY